MMIGIHNQTMPTNKQLTFSSQLSWAIKKWPVLLGAQLLFCIGSIVVIIMALIFSATFSGILSLLMPIELKAISYHMILQHPSLWLRYITMAAVILSCGFFYLYLIFYFPYIVLEGRSLINSLSESIKLAHRNLWRIALPFFTITLGISIISFLYSYISRHVITNIAIIFAIKALLLFIMAPLSVCILLILFYELTLRKKNR
jgi:ABC-type multidrug transport system fused ATPase/permease subunit